MPFLRLSRDRRGYENTYLLHAAHPDAPPRVLYWYRTAPGVRIGRPALDEDAIRTIEAEHPEVDFDWSEILAVSEVLAAEVEEAPAPRRRRARPARKSPSGRQPRAARPPAGEAAGEPADADVRAEEVDLPAEEDGGVDALVADEGPVAAEMDARVAPAAAHDLLESLVGREIATRLHARYAELQARVSQMAADEPTREAWRTRVDALDPDQWVTPEEVLSGVQHADAAFDALRRDLLHAS